MSDHQTVVSGLREWTATHDANVRAAVEMLIEHGHWLHNAGFLEACAQTDYGVTFIEWRKVTELLEMNALYGSGSELAMLRVVVMLARDTLGLSSLDRTNRALVVMAISDALGVA
jgi:hypothetical protein